MDSNPQSTSEGKAVVTVLAAVLERLVKSNAHVPNGDNVTKFHALKAPAISIEQYLERIHKYASCSTECFILALIYIDRLIQRNNFILSELNVHRVCVTAILLAAKFFDDAYYNNAYYAKVGGVLVSEMNGLEVEFLFRINFSLHVTPEVFVKYQDELISHAIGAGLERPSEVAVPERVQPPAPAPTLATVPIPTIPSPKCNTEAWNPTLGKNDTGAERWVQVPTDDQQHQGQHLKKPHSQAMPHQIPKTSRNTNDYHMQRHITPSPPHSQHPMPVDDQYCSSNQNITLANSAPGQLHRSRSNLFPHHPLHIESRPRHNSFPVDVYPNDAYTLGNNPSHLHPHYQTKPAMHATAEVLPCSHFHLLNVTRGVYQQ